MKDGGPAFPAVPNPDFYRGMSLRDYFAAQAMIGLGKRYAGIEGSDASAYVAQEAYKIADAMIAEREKSTAPD